MSSQALIAFRTLPLWTAPRAAEGERFVRSLVVVPTFMVPWAADDSMSSLELVQARRLRCQTLFLMVVLLVEDCMAPCQRHCSGMIPPSRAILTLDLEPVLCTQGKAICHLRLAFVVLDHAQVFRYD